MPPALKFWGVAFGFIIFLWIVSPKLAPEQVSPNFMASIGQDIDQPKPTPEPMAFATRTVPIETQRGKLPLILGLATTATQHNAGLMHYRVWPKTMHGLLFLFQQEDVYSMWMRNTYLPLDIAFIDRNGKILRIAENTQPLTDDPIKSPENTIAILEVPAGALRQWNIKVGSTVMMEFFGNV